MNRLTGRRRRRRRKHRRSILLKLFYTYCLDTQVRAQVKKMTLFQSLAKCVYTFISLFFFHLSKEHLNKRTALSLNGQCTIYRLVRVLFFSACLFYLLHLFRIKPRIIEDTKLVTSKITHSISSALHM